VAHFEPDKITLSGEGVFPRIMFDLPMDKDDVRYAGLVEQAKDNLSKQDRPVEDVPLKAVANVCYRFLESCSLPSLLLHYAFPASRGSLICKIRIIPEY